MLRNLFLKGVIFIQDFRITQIGDGAYSILDAGDSSFYVIEGTDKSVVIDTGISPGKKILPTIRSLTKKPLSLVVTHAHIDHFHHMDEFDDVYMCHDEFKMHDKTLKAMMAGKNLKLHETQDVQTGAEINIGNNVLEIFKVPGHTPGSIVVLEKKNNFLFTGDAIGSGYGVWMQLEDSLPLVQYRDNLILLAQWLSNRGGLMSFWGGHNYQQFQSTLILG
ncbi:MAG: MBL fold metallo-hydrolase, partial [Christensenellaceae bacterium]|nr:MBL fold metallo-hydrolase [Christensenellaceae bacterium]